MTPTVFTRFQYFVVHTPFLNKCCFSSLLGLLDTTPYLRNTSYVVAWYIFQGASSLKIGVEEHPASPVLERHSFREGT
jgi:hypothetical protein